jgi:hypothetical protein
LLQHFYQLALMILPCNDYFGFVGLGGGLVILPVLGFGCGGGVVTLPFVSFGFVGIIFFPI